MCEAPPAIHAPQSGLTVPHKQHGKYEPAAAATASATNEAETDDVSKELAKLSIVTLSAQSGAGPINANSLRAAVSTNKPKVGWSSY